MAIAQHRITSACFAVLSALTVASFRPAAAAIPLANTRAEFERALRERNDYPDRAAEIDRAVWRTFGTTAAIVTVDMGGFSQLTAERGIVHALAQAERMQAAALPSIAQQSGRVIKSEADNLTAVFPDVPAAVRAAIAMQRELQAQGIAISIGIGYGEFLLIANEEVYGNEVNLAFKLGEDLAARGETLLTAAAYDRAPRTLAFERREFTISGLTVAAYKVLP